MIFRRRKIRFFDGAYGCTEGIERTDGSIARYNLLVAALIDFGYRRHCDILCCDIRVCFLWIYQASFMNAQTIALDLPQPLYQRLKWLSEITHRPLDTLVLQVLDTNIPPLLAELPDAMQSELVALNEMPHEELWQIAQSTFARELQTEYTHLREKQLERSLTGKEQKRLDELFHAANRHMLRKAYAAVLLKFREQALPPAFQSSPVR